MLNYEYFCKLGAKLTVNGITFDIKRFNNILETFEKSKFSCDTFDDFLKNENIYFSSLLN